MAKKAATKSVQRRVIRAAGGVVWRRAPSTEDQRWWRRVVGRELPGPLEVVLIHRPDYDDWSLPKGKPDGNETAEQTALREVEEETGLRCSLGPELASTRYVNGKGSDKAVRYWAMTVEAQREREPDDEVDEWRWVADDLADAMLTYPRDRTVLASLRAVLDRV
jgi:8-oxo-dGTP pyrophosphatase MutT (NUDIX family)